MKSLGIADRLSGKIGRQLANPSGAGGRFVGAIMRYANRRPTKALIDALEIRCHHHVLDVGCGDGTALAAIPHAALRCGIDRSETMLAAAGRRLSAPIEAGRASLRHADMLTLPFGPLSFDRIIASNVLYFCEDVPRFVNECRRVARPGALLGIYVTAAASMAKWRFAGAGTHRHFTPQRLDSELELCGVDVASRRILPLALPGGIEGLIAIVRLS